MGRTKETRWRCGMEEWHSPGLLWGAPERELPAWVREAGLGSRRRGFAVVGFFFLDEAEALKGYGRFVDCGILHECLLWYHYPVSSGYSRSILECEGVDSLSGGTNCIMM